MEKLIEIARSFSRKVSLGNYEMVDIFCSQKEECTEEESEATSKRLYHFCKQQVEHDVANLLEERKRINDQAM